MAKEIDKKLLRSLLGLASVVEIRDPYTGGHLWRVGQFSKLLAGKMGLDKEQVFAASIGGFLHDLGKIGVADAILRKAGKLTDEEFAVIQTHPPLGAELLDDHPLAGLVIEAVLHHHERPDGKGYPHGLELGQTDILARIVSVTDAFDAMTSTRPYRQGMPVEKALAIMDGEKGRQFDAPLVEALAALHTTDDRLRHIVGHSDHGIALVTCPSCGPILSVSRHQADGSVINCRSCGGEYSLAKSGDTFIARLLKMTDDPGKLRPRPETEVFDELCADVPVARSRFFVGRVASLIGRGA